MNLDKHAGAFVHAHLQSWASLVAQMVKNSAASAGDPGLIPGSGRSPGKEMTTHSGILTWEIPWTGEPGSYSPWGSKRVGHDWNE